MCVIMCEASKLLFVCNITPFPSALYPFLSLPSPPPHCASCRPQVRLSTTTST